MPITTYGAGKILKGVTGEDALITPTLYVALFTDLAYISDASYGTEVTGGSYAREVVDFFPYADGDYTNWSDSAISIPGMPTCTVTDVALMDAATAGNMWWYITLSTPIAYTSGDNATLAAQSMTIGF